MSLDGYLEMYVARGWPLVVCHAHSKEPDGKLLPHGVKEATTDREKIARWCQERPDANWAVATGAPGPDALDIDDTSVVPKPVAKAVKEAPRTSSPRGGAAFFAGTEEATIKLPYGELRRHGSYQMLPPSIHPTGELYGWIREPRGKLRPAPALVARGRQRAGTGTHDLPQERIRHGARHDFLKDIAIRLARGGIVDERLLLALIKAAFENACEPSPPPQPGSLEELAAWAAGSEIAGRERGEDSQRVERRDELARLLHIAERDVGVLAIRLVGNGSTAALELDLSNGLTIISERFGDLWTHTGLGKFITQNTGINAGAITKSEANRANALIRELADITRDTRAGDIGRDHGHDFLSRAPVARFRLNDQASRYQAFAQVEQGGASKAQTSAPEGSLVLLDEQDGVRFVHCGHLFAHVQARREVSHPMELARRMELAGWSRKGKRGRIKATSKVTSHSIKLPFWLVPAGWEDS